jgi:hypothetical protein
MTSRELEVVETVSELLDAALSDTPVDEDMGCLLPWHVFKATMPSTDTRAHHNAVCHIDTAWLGSGTFRASATLRTMLRLDGP